MQPFVRDHLVPVEEETRWAFLTKQHLLGVFFDSEKACDIAWRCGIL
jgi:hypothetical protein